MKFLVRKEEMDVRMVCHTDVVVAGDVEPAVAHIAAAAAAVLVQHKASPVPQA